MKTQCFLTGGSLQDTVMQEEFQLPGWILILDTKAHPHTVKKTRLSKGSTNKHDITLKTFLLQSIKNIYWLPTISINFSNHYRTHVSKIYIKKGGESTKHYGHGSVGIWAWVPSTVVKIQLWRQLPVTWTLSIRDKHQIPGPCWLVHLTEHINSRFDIGLCLKTTG